MLPTERTLRLLREEGWEPWVVEKWVGPPGFAQVRQDLWNFGDVLAMKEGEPHLIVQTTGATGGSARVKKILAEPRALLWLRSGGRILVHAWRRLLKPELGSRKHWVPRTTEITEEMFLERERLLADCG